MSTVETTKNEAVAPATEAAPTAPVAASEAPAKEKKERAPRSTLVKQNGVTRPGGGLTGKVWEIADTISKSLGQPAPRKAVIEEGAKQGINAATLATQYGRWRRFHGLAREQKPAAPETAKTEAKVETPSAS